MVINCEAFVYNLARDKKCDNKECYKTKSVREGEGIENSTNHSSSKQNSIAMKT
jgi:hypothetical protein